MSFVIRQMNERDIDGIMQNFSRMNKQRAQYERFWQEHQAGLRVTFVAIAMDQVVGYANLVWQSDYAPFQVAGIPEINNMHVLDEFHRQGIGSALVQAAEHVAVAQGKPVIGIGVGLTSNYSAAQRLYPKLGYLPDNRGAQPTLWGDVLYLTKQLLLQPD